MKLSGGGRNRRKAKESLGKPVGWSPLLVLGWQKKETKKKGEWKRPKKKIPWTPQVQTCHLHSRKSFSLSFFSPCPQNKKPFPSCSYSQKILWRVKGSLFLFLGYSYIYLSIYQNLNCHHLQYRWPCNLLNKIHHPSLVGRPPLLTFVNPWKP